MVADDPTLERLPVSPEAPSAPREREIWTRLTNRDFSRSHRADFDKATAKDIEWLLATLAEARRERDGYLAYANGKDQALAESRGRVAELQGLLFKLGTHTQDCAFIAWHSERECDCGLHAALRSPPSSTEPAPPEEARTAPAWCCGKHCFHWRSHESRWACCRCFGKLDDDAYNAWRVQQKAPAPPAVASPAPEPTTNGAALIAAERRRQVEAEGWTAAHDDAHDDGLLGLVAACYASPVPIRAKVEVSCGCRGLSECFHFVQPTGWADPFPPSWPDKRKTHDRQRQLVIAGALVAAEIDRLSRASSSVPAPVEPSE